MTRDSSANGASDSRARLAQALLRKLHQTIAKITQDFSGRWHFNTSIAAIMELVNEILASLRRRWMRARFLRRRLQRCFGL